MAWPTAALVYSDMPRTFIAASTGRIRRGPNHLISRPTSRVRRSGT